MVRVIILSILLLAAPLAGAASSSQFEQKDLLGSTVQYLLTVGLSSQLVPAVADKTIAEVLVRCSADQPNARRCQVAFDNSTNWITLRPGEFVGWGVKGYQKQITVLGNNASTSIEVIINYEP